MRFDWKATVLAGVMAVGGLTGSGGCGETDSPTGDPTVTGTESAFHWSHRRPNMGRGATGGVAGGVSGGTGGASGVTAGCDVCTRANSCCNAVNAGALCTFSASTCASLAPASRDPYIVGCLTMINAVTGTHPEPVAGCDQ